MATQLKDDEILFTDIAAFDASGNRIIDLEILRASGKKKVKTGDYWIDIERYICSFCTDKKDSSDVWVLPIKERTIDSPYGNRLHPIYNEWRMHYGVDLGGYKCEYSPILAAKAGTITAAYYDRGGAGHYVDIKHNDGFITRYLHMGPSDKSGETYKHIVSVGQVVRAGQVIGSVGTSGGSTGPHLHFGIKYNGNYVNPTDHINFSTASIRVQKDVVTHDDFSPLFGHNSAVDYQLSKEYHQYIIRRGLILNSSVTLYENGKMNRSIGAGNSGIGPIGVHDTQSNIDSISLTDNNFTSNINPYIKNSMNNNAYCWARAKKIVDSRLGNFRDYFLCKNYKDNWYEYNKENSCFDYGKIPRKYSIACWESIDSTNEKTRVAIVDEVIGTNVIIITEGYYLRSGTYSTLTNSSIHERFTITNPDGNWGQDKKAYKFLGFIYLLNNSDIDSKYIKTEQNGCETVFATKDNKYASLTFATHNIKHYNKIRLICDIDAHDLVGGKSKPSGQIYIMASQQVLRYEVLDDDWYETKFNDVPSYENVRDFSCNYPFPNGAVQLAKLDMRNSVDTGTFELDMTVPLNSCKFADTENFNTFSNDKYTVFNRESPLFISIIPMAYEDDINNCMTVEVTVKKIILYR